MLAILTEWCAQRINKPEVIDEILNALALSIERNGRFLALIGRALTVNSKPYIVQRFAGHLFINELSEEAERGYSLDPPRLRCGWFPVAGDIVRRPEDAGLFSLDRFDVTVKRTGNTERQVSCSIAWSSQNILLGGGMGILFTSNYGGNDDCILLPLPPLVWMPIGSISVDLNLLGLELVDRGASLIAEIVQLGGYGVLPNVVSAPVLRVLCV